MSVHNSVRPYNPCPAFKKSIILARSLWQPKDVRHCKTSIFPTASVRLNRAQDPDLKMQPRQQQSTAQPHATRARTPVRTKTTSLAFRYPQHSLVRQPAEQPLRSKSLPDTSAGGSHSRGNKFGLPGRCMVQMGRVIVPLYFQL